ncbi:hypothetical protein GCM10007382_24110 [Salinibacterium xinjiangense]|uniref:Uncharacterized protein n=1 Tax=Salinibacterium xinjiangense TaxID=386302 RepID=A0A2C9A0J9_9MICO|nr:hypothetical protein [Salinibacterium xinjiangense]GGL03520.1 hypothetical protein GCM10007382_24110 [Salinibacterium xinjiangense]SOE72394.1 hypothetical protein SAMN06296378_2481 [Salinibacterium xinjiangense]
MGDELVIGGSGSFAVGTDELFTCAEQLRELWREMSALGSDLGVIDSLVSPWQLRSAAAPASAFDAEAEIHRARMVIAEVELQSRAMESAIEAAAAGYGFAEHFVGRMIHEFTGQFGAMLARFSPMLLLATLTGTAVLGVAGGILIEKANAGGQGPNRFGPNQRGPNQRGPNQPSRSPLGSSPLGSSPFSTSQAGRSGESHPAPWFREHNEIITNPLTVDLVRLASQASGDVVAGALGVPPQLTSLLGGAGVMIGSTAVMRAGSTIGLFKETPVRLVDTHMQTVSGSPNGFAERLSRVPDTETTDGAQVVIEKYSTPGDVDRFEVYIAGTVTFSPSADSEPWDMTSNMANAAGFGGGSYASVAAAMELAGIDSSSPVQFTGYSQGGGTAARLAASGDYNTQGLASFGGPTGQVQIPEGFPTVIVEHTDDIVPALGGEQVNNHAVLVERAVFSGREVPTDYAVPAHHYEYYEETARLMDKARSDQITKTGSRLDSFSSGATSVTSTAYQYERVPSQ